MRNKKLANRILIFLFLGFILITLFKIFIFNNFTIELLSFVMEAALVGGIADWFAITALFRAPLGFTWHTALIPRNREKVIEAVSVMVENELLSYEFIKTKIEEVPIMDMLISYVENNNTKKGVAKFIEKYGQGVLSKFDTEKIAEYIEGFIKDKLKDVDISIQIKKIIDWAVESGQYEQLLENIIDALIVIASKESTKGEIYNIINDVIEENKSKATGLKRMFFEMALGIAKETDSVNIGDAAGSLQKELISILTNLKDKNDPMYIRFDQMVKDAIKKLETEPSVKDSIEAWKQEVMERIHLKDELQKIINGAIKITSDASNTLEVYNDNVTALNTSPIMQWLTAQIEKYWKNFKQDTKIKKWLEDYIKENLVKIIKAEHHILGMMVRDTLGSFTNEALNEFIEVKAGNDLHWIRINGSIVGAVVGVIIFLFEHLLYDPYVVPVIRTWF